MEADTKAVVFVAVIITANILVPLWIIAVELKRFNDREEKKPK